MTVYQGTLAYRENLTSSSAYNPELYRWNLALLTIAAAVVFGYVFLSNLLTAQKYALDVSRAKYDQQSATLAAANSDANLKKLTHFAESSGMVEVKNSDAIFEDYGVAYRP